MKPEILKNPNTNYDVTILQSAKHTNGSHSLFEVNLYAGGGNELHYHTTFSEHFEVISGTLSVQVGKIIHELGPGQSYTVSPFVPHRFFNTSSAPAVFQCTVTPARNFEKALRIGFGLANDGLMTAKGMPKNFWHAIVLFDLSESYLHGLPLWFQRATFGGLARIAKWMKIDRQLMRYVA